MLWIKSKWLRLFCFIIVFTEAYSFSTSVVSLENDNTIRNAIKANQLYNEGLYQDAIPLYTQLTCSYPFTENVTKDHLAQCYLEMGLPQLALNSLNGLSPFPAKNFQHLFVKSVAHRQLNQYAQALNILRHIPHFNAVNSSVFETALNFYHLKDYKKAYEFFMRVKWDFENPSLYFFTQIYLSRLQILQNQPKAALQILNSIVFPQLDSLYLERCYLKGVCEYLLGDYINSIHKLEKLLSTLPTNKSPWLIFTLRQLTMCYLLQSNQLMLAKEQKGVWLEKADSTLQRLMAISNEEKDYLILGDFYLAQAHFSQNELDFQKAKLLFERKELFNSAEINVIAKLKSIESCRDYLERSKQFQALTLTDQEPSIAKKCWLYRAINAFREGSLLLNQQLADEAADCFNEAFHAFFKLLR